MRTLILALLLALAVASPAAAALNVVATLPWIGSLAREIGRDRVTVTVLVKPGQDPHTVEAKPGMILAGRKADMVMYNGLDLEIGYLPLILEAARNPRIVPGKPGHLDCSRFVRAIERRGTADRSLGDVHPQGNPHYHFSPANVLRVAEGMTTALAELDPANADRYRANGAAFAARWRERQPRWQSLAPRGRHYVAYHRLFEYLAAEYGFTIDGYIEPKPGIPASAAHIARLTEEMKARRPDGILVTAAGGRKEAEALGHKTGVRVVVLPQDVGAEPGTDDLFSFMDRVLAALRPG